MDIRAQRTRAALEEALLACMKEMPLKNVQVKEICERAGVNRITFYKHYRDLAAMIDEMQQKQLNGFRDVLQAQEITGEPLLRSILASIDRAQDLYHVKDGGTLPESFKTGLIATALKYGERGWKARVPKVDEREAALVYEALLGGALQVALSPNAKADREKVVKTIMGMFNAYVEAHQ